jgi:hypothetical protein
LIISVSVQVSVNGYITGQEWVKFGRVVGSMHALLMSGIFGINHRHRREQSFVSCIES